MALAGDITVFEPAKPKDLDMQGRNLSVEGKSVSQS